jgi:predicted TIM-barrel fold metal-dependent hydrolase
MKKPDKLVNIHAHLHANMDVPARVREWEEHNCVKCCVLADSRYWQPPRSTYLGNDGVLKWMRAYPDFIVGMGNVELGNEMGSADDIDRLREQGFSGLKLEMPSHPYDDDRYMPLYERAEQLQMPVLFHTGWVMRLGELDRDGRLSSESMRAFRLDRIARSFPQLQVIGSHLGMPHADEALALLDGMPNAHFDMSWDISDRGFVSRLKRALAPFPGADWDDPEQNLALRYFKKIAFGTDDPPIGDWLPVAEEILDYLHVPEDTRKDFYWRNATRIFGWDL